MAELNAAPTYEQQQNLETTPFQSGDGIDFHTTSSEGIATYARGHALAQTAALDQRLNAAQGGERKAPNLAPEIAYLQQASGLLARYRQYEQQQKSDFDLAA